MAIGDIAGDLKTTYGQDLTPEQRAARQAALVQAGGPSSLNGMPINVPPSGPIGRAQQAAVPASGLNQANLVTPSPQGPQPPPLTNLAQVGGTTGAGLLRGPASALPAAAPIGPVPTATSPTVDPFKIQSVRDQNSLHNANLLANPTPVDPASLAGPITQDQFRPTGVGAGSSGGQIVARVGPNGEPQFSNAPADQRSAQGLGQISVTPASGPQPSGSLASLGSLGNLGDGVGAFSQAQTGDAALSAERFGRANEIRQGTQNQNRLDQALGAQWVADHTNVVHDSSRPLTTGQKQSDDSLQQTRDQANNKASLSQAVINSNLQNRSGEQQLKQATSLNDLQARATAPDATAVDQQNYLRAKDPAGLLKLQQTAPQAAATLAKTQAETNQTLQKIATTGVTQQQTQQDRTVAKEGQQASFDQALGSIDGLLGTQVDPKNPDGPRLDEDKGLSKTLGPVDGIIPNFPGTAGADFEAKLDTLKARTFLPQVAALKGTGALSDAEGTKLTNSIGALSTKMTEGAFRKSLAEVRSTLQAAKERNAKAGPQVSAPQAAPANPNQGALTAQPRATKPVDHSNLWGG